ncbi:MAG: 50S ribosomal protein L9 [Alphaproteobacteria bacterium]|nr:50S ribosomal protein L9 [Alphaproteobacteria bacterium]
MATQLILLERVEKLGNMGDVVSVKPGYARNYLLPQKKALRASKDNVAYFEAQKKAIESQSNEQKKDAEKLAKKVAGIKVPLIRAASESGQLYGSVNTRDIAQAAAETSGEALTRPMVKINTNFKTVGLFPVNIQLHPEVIVEITVNIARSKEEAQIQAETGRALMADDSRDDEPQEEAVDEDALAGALEDDALEANKERTAEEAAKAAEEAAKTEVKSAKRAEKKAAKAEEEGEDEIAELTADAPAEESKED